MAKFSLRNRPGQKCFYMNIRTKVRNASFGLGVVCKKPRLTGSSNHVAVVRFADEERLMLLDSLTRARKSRT